MLPKSVLLFLVIAVFKSLQGQYIVDDYVLHKDPEAYYKIHTIPRTWNEAQTTCEVEGAVLYSPEDGYEVLAVKEYWEIREPNITRVFINVVKNNLISDEGLPKTGFYLNWHEGEPNGRKGTQDCTILNIDGTLHDEDCHKKYPFICKKLPLQAECGIPYPGYVFRKVMNKCYKFHSTPEDWRRAMEICKNEKSYLAAADSASETIYFVSLISYMVDSYTEYPEAIHQGFFWDRNAWYTLQYTNFNPVNKWARGQPNNTFREECGAMDVDGLFHDVDCIRKLPFICAHDVLTPHKPYFKNR